MKKLALKTVSLLVLFFFAVAAFGLRATAAPANPFPVEVEQADGSVITVRGFGDEFFHWTEADDGYVVAFDIASQNWCYAYIYDNEILPGPEIVGGGLVEARETAIDSEDEQATESANDSNNEQAAETIIDSEGEQAAETAAPSDDDETTATTETTETDSVGAVVNRPLPDPAAPPVIPPRITAADLQGLIAAADTAAHTQTIPGSGAGGGYSTTSQAGSVANWNPALLVILIEYDNASMVKDISHWHDHFFNTAPGYNSVNNFYLENSAGAFQYRPATFSQSGAITDSLPAGVASITVQNGVAKVKLNKNHPGNIQATIGADITAAYNAIRGYINFSAFPYSDYYGYIKSSDFTVTTVIAGWELSNSANSSRQQAVWAHARSSTFNNDPIILSVRATDKELLSYTTQGEIYSGPMDAGAVPMGIGVTAHELGHTFGLPDLYDTSSNSEGVGPYSVMASGSWTAAEGETPGYTPTHFDAWSKVFLGFVEPAVIASGDYRRVNVNSIGASPADYNVVKVTDPVNESQYFLIENRGLTGYDSGLYRYYIGPAYNNNGGIMIWHVDESVTAANGQLSNANRQRRAVDVEAADGNTLLYLKGVPINYYQNVNHFFSTDFYTVSGSGDYLGASGAHNLFAPATSPNSNFYAANGTSQSVATAIEIEINSPRGASMDVDFGAVPEHFLAIGPDYYDTLDEALAAVAAGGAETIRLLRDYSQDEAAAIDNQHIILDLNGFRLAIPRLELSGGGTVTIEGGTVAPGVVFQLGATEKTLADYADASATTKAGYRTYSDGGSTVWVKGAAPTIMGQASATAHLRKWDDYSEFTASYALVSDIAPRLDVDITEIDGATHTVSGGLLSLTIPAGLPIGAYTATVTADNGIAAATLTLTLVIVEAGTLDPPGQPDITYAGPVSATVVWEGSEGADDYWIYRNGVLVAQLPHQTDGTIQSWTDRAVLPEVSYIYRVTAHCVYNGNNIFEDSEVSDEYLAPPLPPLTGLWSAPGSAGRVRLGWDMLDDVEAFEIYLAPYQAGQAPLATVPGSENSGEASGAPVPVFDVRAKWRLVGQDGEFVANVFNETARTASGQRVTGLKATIVNPFAVSLTWDEFVINGISPLRYEIWRSDEFTSAASPLGSTADALARTFRDDTLISGRTYFYTVRPVWGGASPGQASQESAQVRARTSMQIPTGFRAAASRPSEIDLTWKRVAGADGYEIFLVGQGLVGKIADNNTTSYTLEGLKPGTTYYTMVRAYWGERGGTYSAVLTRATSGPAPSGLARSDVTATSATIRWNAAAGAPSGYVVYRDGVRLGAATATQFTDNDLTPGVAVKYTVRAYWNNDDTQMGAMSSALSVTPPGPLPSLRGFSTTPTSIMVNWNAITGDVNLAGFQGYRVYISGELVDENVITATSRTINNLSPNTLYQVQIAGVWNGREGRRANAASIRTAGPAPGGLARVSLTATSAAIKWNAVNPSPSGYIVYRDGVELATTKATGFTDNSLTPGVAVRYAVRAFWGEEAQLGAASGTLNLTPPGGTVSGLRAVPGTVGPTGATVAWQGAAGVAGASVTGYNVYLLVDGKAADPVPSATLNASLHNLNPATRYQVQVAPVWKIGSEDREGRRSNPVNITTAGPAPAWAPPSVTSTSVALSWNPPANASGLTGYRISRAVGKGAFEEYAEVGNVRAWKDEDVNPGQPYRYIIQALWGEGKPGNNSAVRTVTPPGPAPTRFSVVREDGTAALRWSLTNAADNQNVNAFLITKTVGAAVEEIRIPRTSSLNFMWNDMKFMNPGVTVRYQVQALWGAEVAGNTVTGGKPGNKTATRSLTPSGASGAAPGGLKAAVAGPTRVNVSWNAIAEKNAGGLLSYNLYLDGRLVKNVPKGGTRFVTLENLNPGQQYQVKVVGVWTSADMNWLGAREGKSSPIVRVRPTGAAPASLNVAANTLTGTSVRLTWRPVTQPEVWGYRIMRAVGGAAAVSVDITMAEYLANGNGWTDTGLSPGVPARYSVSALWEISDDEGEPLLVPGAMSKSRNVRPLGVAPSSVAGTAGSPTSITVTWNPPPNVAGASVGGYRVEIFAPATKAGPRALVGETEARGPLRATFSGLSPHSAYQVRVTPLWDCGVGGEREGLASGFVNVATR